VNDFSVKQIAAFVALGLIALLAIFGLLGSWFLVNQGERAVVLRNGAYVRVAEPGLGFKVPIIDSVVDLSVRTEKKVYEKMTSYSRDIQLAEIRVAVNYRLDVSRVKDVYENYGGQQAAVDRILTPRGLDNVKVVFGRFNAKTAIEERGRLGNEMEQEIRNNTKDTGLLIESVQLEEIDFSKAFEQSIEDRMKAEVEVAKLQQNLAREKVQADIVRTQAQAQADRVLMQAKADAEAIRLKGDAEASAIKARAHALQANASLIELVKAEKWNGTLPTTMLPNGAVPMLSLSGR